MLQLFSRPGAQPAPPDDLKVGDRFCRTLGNYVETATIRELRRDLVGIPHVTFTVVFEHPDAVRIDDGPRTLALARFVDEYQKQAALSEPEKTDAALVSA